MKLFREEKGKLAYSIVESDGQLTEHVSGEIKKNKYVQDVMLVNLQGGTDGSRL